MNHKKVAEHWREGKSAKGSRMYSDGEAIYSYGDHFPMAVWLNPYRTSVAICSDTYSISTSKHQHIVGSVLNDFYGKKTHVSLEGIKNIRRERSSNPDAHMIVVKEKVFVSDYDPMR